MSASRAFQKAIVAALKADAGVGALVGDRIYDMPPAEATFPYISIGPSDFVPADDECIAGIDETLQIDVWDRTNGQKHPCRAIVSAVYDALHDAALSLDDPYACNTCRVSLAQVIDDPDGITAHGIVQVNGLLEDTA